MNDCSRTPENWHIFDRVPSIKLTLSFGIQVCNLQSAPSARILLVEDDSSIAAATVATLRSHLHAFDHVRDGIE